MTTGIHGIRLAKSFVDMDTLISIYNAFFEHILIIVVNYIRDVFGNSQTKRPQKVQNRATRIILN